MAREPKSDYTMTEIKNPTKAHVVVCFGMLSHRILFEHDSEEVCKAELEFIRAEEHRMKAAAKGYTRKPHKHDFDVRTPEDLEALTRAIRSFH